MIETKFIIIRHTDNYNKWFSKLKDNKLKSIIITRLRSVAFGNFGDFKSVGDGVYELRFKVSGGIRIYYSFYNNILILLLTGGNKGTQTRDIKKAKEILHNFKIKEG